MSQCHESPYQKQKGISVGYGWQKAPSEKMVLFFAIRRSPSCRPSLARCRGRQTGHFLEIASLLPPPAALRRFPRPARSAFQSRGEAGFLRMASPFAGCREASSSLGFSALTVVPAYKPSLSPSVTALPEGEPSASGPLRAAGRKKGGQSRPPYGRTTGNCR